jgi:hypothetical protein
MAVYDMRGKSWLDYAMPIITQLLGSGMERTNQAKQYELQKRTAEEEMARKQQMADWQSQKMYGAEKPQPVIPGMEASLPYMPPTYREGGILNGIDLRGNPNDAYSRIAGASPYMDPEFIKQQGNILGNLNALMTFQQINQGDRITAGPFDPGSGSFNGQSYDVGVDPSIADTNAKNLEAQKIARDAQIRAAQIAASSRGGGAAQPKYDMTVNPKTGTIVYIAPNQPPFDTGIPAQSPQGQQMLTPKDIAGMYEAFERGQGNRLPGEERPENPFFPIVQSLLPIIGAGQPVAGAAYGDSGAWQSVCRATK